MERYLLRQLRIPLVKYAVDIPRRIIGGRHLLSFKIALYRLALRLVPLPNGGERLLSELCHVLSVQHLTDRIDERRSRAHIRCAVFRLQKGSPFRLFHAEQLVLFIKNSEIVNNSFRVVRSQLIYRDARVGERLGSRAADRQHTVPCIAVGVHILLRYGVIGQQVHLHRRDFIFFVYNVHLPVLSLHIGQCPVSYFLFIFIAVVHDRILALA